jgi:hypothetical protein
MLEYAVNDCGGQTLKLILLLWGDKEKKRFITLSPVLTKRNIDINHETPFRTQLSRTVNRSR